MRTSRTFLAILQVSVLLVLSACQSRKFHNTIAIIPRNTAEAFSVTEHAGAAEAARKFHLTIFWNGPSGEDDVQQQIALSERAIDGGSLGVVLSPGSPFALDTVIQRALAHAIPVVIVGSSIPLAPSRNLSFVLDNVQQTGALAAMRLKEVLQGKGEISLLGVDPMYAGSVERAIAIEASLHQIAPSIRIVGKPAGTFSFGQTEQDAEGMIRSHPRLSAIVALNVTATRAAVAAVRATRSVDQIRIIGCDQGLDLLFLLRHGVIDSIIVQNMRAMGAMAVTNIVVLRHGKAVTPVIRIQPVLITRSNIDNENIQNMLTMDWRPRP
jgi:ribose transport system substrate-binding protein